MIRTSSLFSNLYLMLQVREHVISCISLDENVIIDMEDTFDIPEETSTLVISNNEDLDVEKTQNEQEVTLENEDINENNRMEKEGENSSSEHDIMLEIEDPGDPNYVIEEKRISSESTKSLMI
ncbi:hypothetical protein ILUMI_01161 [Ignelater luminosus]|uniref:Uncharacterized protein n=1 Tax=Ignelater luminosus TaxID=2038154 RepID=A0A8K0DJ12_IGNLU|nr:hypothetical protein ILUMI_01161 [Ignelater luminosus]